MSMRVYLTLVSGLLLVQLVLAAILPPAPDELYYWCWAKELQWSYYDHPPMTAYLIRASISVFGDTLFAIRLPACLGMFAILLVQAKLTRPVWPTTLIMATPLCFFGGILITPDAPLLCAWAGYLLWLVHLHGTLHEGDGPDWRTWTLGGVLLGLGILSKYTMGLAGLTAALSLLTLRPWRRWMPGLIGHGVVAFVVSLPILIYNIQRDFEPLLYQWQHTMQVDEPSIRYLPEYVGVQIVLVGLLPFVLTPWLLWNWRTLNADPRLRACRWMFLAPFLFFLYKASRDRLEPNWPVACYLAFCPLAACWFERMRGRFVMQGLGLLSNAAPVLALLAVCWHLISPLTLITPEKDRLHRQASWYELSRKAGAAVQGIDPDVPVFAPTYQDTAYLRFHRVRAEQLPGDSRPSHFTQRARPAELPDRFLVFAHFPIARPGFGPPKLLEEFPLTVRGQVVGTYQLLRYERTQ